MKFNFLSIHPTCSQLHLPSQVIHLQPCHYPIPTLGPIGLRSEKPHTAIKARCVLVLPPSPPMRHCSSTTLPTCNPPITRNTRVLFRKEKREVSQLLCSAVRRKVEKGVTCYKVGGCGKRTKGCRAKCICQTCYCNANNHVSPSYARNKEVQTPEKGYQLCRFVSKGKRAGGSNVAQKNTPTRRS